jgi:outer membrane protein with beta-barrel domain
MNLEPPFPSSSTRRGTALAVAAAVLTLASSAFAVEREDHLGVDLGGSALIIADKSSADIGPALGAHWAYGLSDAFNLMVEGGWSIASLRDKPGPKIPSDRPAWIANADVGVGYVFDVLQWVPYAGLLVGGEALSGGTLPRGKFFPNAVVALGLDYRLSPRLAVGAALRQQFTALESSTYPSFTQAFARLEYTWGW